MMKYSMSIVALFIAAAVSGTPIQVIAGQAEEQALIEKSIASYTAAFNARDAKALATHWSANAVYTNPLTGNEVQGRAAIELEFDEILTEAKDVKLAVEVESIRFISPSVAVENGIANVISAEGEPQQTSYTAIHVKHGDSWLLDRVTEEEVSRNVSHYKQLKELEWLIGTWVDSDEEAVIETTCQWTKNKNFMTRSFAVSIGDQVDLSGMQFIGWDPAAQQIRSWVFDSDGGFAEGRWDKHETGWSITSTGILADGSQATSVNIITIVDADQFKWRSVNRTLSGKLQPNIDEVIVVRSQAAE